MAIKRVLITGVAGFIASNLLDYLLENCDWEIHGVDNLSTGRMENIQENMDHPSFTFIEQSCTDLTSLKPYDAVFHLAALPRIQPSFEFVREHVHANVINGVHLLELMIKDSHFPRFVYSGSSAIYGDPLKFPTDESESIKCMNPYAFQKYELEKYIELLATRFPFDFVNLRYFNPYGPRSFNPDNKFNAYSSVVGIFLYRKMNNMPLLITGDGAQKRDFIHVADVARANYLAAIHPDKLNSAFNVGHGSTLSVLELAKLISDDYSFIEKREGEAEITFANRDKSKNVLGWEPIHNLQQYVQETLASVGKSI